MDRPTLRQLEAFEAIVRMGSFRAAARSLGISQVAVSDHVRELESRLGVLLFDRSKGGKARLSLCGEEALPRVRLVLADCDALLAAMQRGAPGADKAMPPPLPAEILTDLPADDAETGFSLRAAPAALRTVRAITIGTHPSIFEHFRMELSAFEEEFPDRPLNLDFDCFVTDQVALAFSEGRIDLALFYALGESRVLASDYLWSERWSLFVGEGHRLSGLDHVGRDDLAGEALLAFTSANPLRPLFSACMARGGLGDMPVCLESDDHALLAGYCREGAGVLPLFGVSASRVASMEGLRRLSYVEQIPAVEVRRAINPRASGDPEAGALTEMVRLSLG